MPSNEPTQPSELLPDECLFCGSVSLHWKADHERNCTVQVCRDCGEIVRRLPRGVLPYDGGWYVDQNGQRRFLMPPYPGVDYLP